MATKYDMTFSALQGQLDAIEEHLASFKIALAEARKQGGADPAIPPEPGWWEGRRKHWPLAQAWSTMTSDDQEWFMSLEQDVLDHAMRRGDGLERAAQELKRRYSIACCASPSHPVANHLFKAINPLQEYLSELRTER